MSLLEHEREAYTHAFAVDRYSVYSPGEQYLPLFCEMAGIQSHEHHRYTVLDAGTGSGKGALALKHAKFMVTACDFVDGRVPEARDVHFKEITSLWDDLRSQLGYLRGGRIDYVYCTDVLEHIPPEFTMLTVRRLLDVCTRGVFLTIALVPDAFGYQVGRPLHQCVMPYVWWRDHLNTVGRVKEARDLILNAAFLVEPC